MSTVSSSVPTPPVGAILFYWYGLEGANWSKKSDSSGTHSIVLNSDSLDFVRSGGASGALSTIQTSEVYSGGAGKTLYIRYELVSLSGGSIQELDSHLEDIATTTGNVAALINLTSFAVDGEHLENSPGTTDTQTTYAPKIEMISFSGVSFVLRIYELYYLT